MIGRGRAVERSHAEPKHSNVDSVTREEQGRECVLTPERDQHKSNLYAQVGLVHVTRKREKK